LVKLGTTRKLLSRHNLNKDHVTEFILYYVKPFAARHGLPMDKELDDYLLVGADYLLDMEDGAEPFTVSLLAQVAGTEACTMTTSASTRSSTRISGKTSSIGSAR
jgi:hypothetical protein